MSVLEQLPVIELENQLGYRLINSKFPPIELFDDVADKDEFEALYEIQALTNPRLLNEAGDLSLLTKDEIPFNIPGCSYATAPFTHVNPDGSRFSNGDYGVLYVADTVATAIAEVRYHQSSYWAGVHGLKYDRLVFRGLTCRFGANPVRDATVLEASHAIYDPQDYQASRSLGAGLKTEGAAGIQYHSVRHPGATCWGLFSPRGVSSVVQAAHYEMIWDGATIRDVNQLVTHRRF